MGRNKYIYALADYALIVSSAFGKGGTWAGAVEALSRIKEIPVFVRSHPHISEGNQQLYNQGAKPFPAEPWNHSLRELLTKAASVIEPVPTEEDKTSQQTTRNPSTEIYDAVLPLILNHLQQPKDAKSLAESLDVRLSQMQDWLNRAVIEGKVRKINKPVVYIANQGATQLSLL
jgi:predicted Rossmann fold nucleotide-binding protein DprA/Smf involved in DNA uptake